MLEMMLPAIQACYDLKQDELLVLNDFFKKAAEEGWVGAVHSTPPSYLEVINYLANLRPDRGGRPGVVKLFFTVLRYNLWEDKLGEDLSWGWDAKGGYLDAVESLYPLTEDPARSILWANKLEILSWAAKGGYLDVVEYLYPLIEDPAKAIFGFLSAFEWAAHAGNLEIVKFFALKASMKDLYKAMVAAVFEISHDGQIVYPPTHYAVIDTLFLLYYKLSKKPELSEEERNTLLNSDVNLSEEEAKDILEVFIQTFGSFKGSEVGMIWELNRDFSPYFSGRAKHYEEALKRIQEKVASMLEAGRAKHKEEALKRIEEKVANRLEGGNIKQLSSNPANFSSTSPPTGEDDTPRYELADKFGSPGIPVVCQIKNYQLPSACPRDPGIYQHLWIPREAGPPEFRETHKFFRSNPEASRERFIDFHSKLPSKKSAEILTVGEQVDDEPERKDEQTTFGLKG